MNYIQHQGNSITLERPSSQNYPLASYVPGDGMLVFIDPKVEDAQMLAAGVQLGAEVLILDSNRDGVEQITEVLQGRTDISSVHLVSHGSPGCLHLGSTKLNLDTLDQYVSYLQTWSNSIFGASLLLYGCRVASGEMGSTFLQRLHQLTGANIAASNQRVGNAALGGSWQLKSRIGLLTSGVAFLPEVTQAYAGVFPTPEVSLQAITATVDESDNLVANALVRSVESGASLLTFVFSLDEPPPENGVIVTVNSDIAGSLADYFTNLGRSPFSPGGEVLEAVYDETGRATGFRFRIDESNAIISLPVLNNSGETGPQQVSFSLQDGIGYTVNEDASASTVTFYDTLEQVPSPTVVPQVGLTVSNNTLVESQGSETTLTFNLSAPPPPDGVLVYVNSGVGGAVGDFDIFNAEIEGGVFPAPNFETGGFYFRILDQTASITLPVFSDDVSEGREGFTYSLQPGSSYTVAPNASAASITIADTPESEIQVSYAVEPTTLIESARTVSAHTFTLSAPPPPQGVTVNVTAPLGEFNVSAAQVTGGSIAEVDGGFAFTITEQTGTINLPVLNDAVGEGREQLTFSLEPGAGYQINSDASSFTLNAVDTPRQVPPPTVENESNDTIATALNTRLSSLNPNASISGAIAFDGENNQGVDNTEDVDFYSFQLSAGETVNIDTDTTIDSVLRLFDSEGTQLAVSDDNPASNELFVSRFESYIEFTAEEAGTYYVGVSTYDNFGYNPSTAGSGSGSDTGAYELALSLVTEEPVNSSTGTATSEVASSISEGTSTTQGGDSGPVVSLQTTTATFNESDDLVANALVQSVESGGSVLSLLFSLDEPPPSEGVVVTVNTDSVLIDNFVANNRPYSVGGEVLEAVYDPETGQGTGFTFRIDESNAFVNLAVLNNSGETGSEQVSFSLLDGAGYTVNEDASASTVTLYDTLEQVPAPTVVPQVGLTVSNNTLVESQGTETTLTFNLSEPPPPDGVLVYVSSGVGNAVGEFDIFNAEFEGGFFPTPDFQVGGFYFNITEQTASITLPVFSDSVTEGLQEFTYSLQPSAGYTVAPTASSATVTIADTPESELVVSLEAASTTLIESQGTETTFTFNLSASPPAEGVTLTLNSEVPGFSEEFNGYLAEVTGGTLDAVNTNGFVFTITEPTATFTLPALNDGDAEGLEELTFSLASGDGYQINEDTSEVTLTLVDNSGQLPPPSVEGESNDIISTAVNTRLSSLYQNISISGAIDLDDNNEGVDATEDVDFYSFNLTAGDTITIDIDASQFSSELDSELRLFDSEGTQLVSSNNDPAPDEFFVANRDPYIDFTAEEAGTYYVGVSMLGNRTYDPFTAGSGSGRINPDSGINTGEYDLNMTLRAA